CGGYTVRLHGGSERLNETRGISCVGGHGDSLRVIRNIPLISAISSFTVDSCSLVAMLAMSFSMRVRRSAAPPARKDTMAIAERIEIKTPILAMITAVVS